MNQIVLFALLFAVCMPYTLPVVRRVDYPEDQDCHLCHAVVKELSKRIGHVATVGNVRRVMSTVCKASNFKDYALTGDEIMVYCDRFVKDNANILQVAMVTRYKGMAVETVDNRVCNQLKLCPHGWKNEMKSEETIVDRDEEEL